MMRRAALLASVAAAVLAIAASAAAQRGDEPPPPTELWEEFPLDSERSPAPPRDESRGAQSQPEENAARRQTRPTGGEDSAASADDGLPIGTLAIGGIGALALLAGTVVMTLRGRRPAEPAPQRPAPAAARTPRDEAWLDEPEVDAPPPPHGEPRPEPVRAPVEERTRETPAAEEPAPAADEPEPTFPEPSAAPPEPPEPHPPGAEDELPDEVIPFPTARTPRVARHSVPETAGKAVGYVSAPEAEGQGPDLDAQTEAIRAASVRHGFDMVEVVRDVEPYTGPELDPPGLVYAIEKLEGDEAGCLLVTSLERLTSSAEHLSALIDRLGKSRIRLIVLDIDLDTGNPDGRLAAEALAKIGSLERRTLDEATRTSPEPVPELRRTGRPAVADRPALKRRIAEMRARGMTLQAIADTLNAEGIPTLRGGAEWRPSSVQAAAGYKRPKKNDGGESGAEDARGGNAGR